MKQIVKKIINREWKQYIVKDINEIIFNEKLSIF